MRQTVESIMRSFQNSGKRHLLLTGNRGVGKTTRFREIVKLLTDEPELPGITTYAIPRNCVMLRENGTESESKIGEFLNGMHPVEKGFEELGIPALNRAKNSNSPWVSIDELGFLEANNEAFQKAVISVFDEKNVLAIIRKQDILFLEMLKNREDVFVVDLDETKSQIGCIIMASGLGVRFGGDKLLEKVDGKTLIERALENTENVFAKRVVVTRSEAVLDYCEKNHIEVIFHKLPNRNDTVRLGVEYLNEMDGWVFCPCDQPYLKPESLKKMLEVPYVHEDMMIRFAYRERVGAPIFFGKLYEEELRSLPEKKGGSYLIKKYPDKVTLVQVEDEIELWDIDTKEDLQKMEEIVRSRN